MKRQDYNDVHRYDDIINLPHHVSAVHPHMPIRDRAAQFSPFAALTGYEDAIKETGRLTDEKVELNEDEKEILNEKLRMLQERIADHPAAEITYFCPDGRKAGGAYLTVAGHIKKINEYEKLVVMEEGVRIAVEEIVEINLQFQNNDFDEV